MAFEKNRITQIGFGRRERLSRAEKSEETVAEEKEGKKTDEGDEGRWPGGVWYVACGKGDCVVDRALESVEELLPNMAIDAPIGSVVVEIRRLVRLAGEEIDRVRRRASVRWSVGNGSLVGSLAA